MNKKVLSMLKLFFDLPPAEAIRLLEAQDIKITWDWQEQLAAVRKRAFTVAKVSSADILQTIKEELEKAMKRGDSYTDFKNNLEPLLEQKGYAKKEDGSAWRLDTIYRTNMQSAYMAGRYMEMKEAEAEFPYWQFIAITDNRTTDGCLALNGVILPSNHPFWETNYPPRHYKCRSRVKALSKRLMERKKLRITPDDLVSGIKPAKGFESSPGEWKPDMSKYDKDIRETLESIMKSYN